METVHRVNSSIPIILDTKGPEVRVTAIAEQYDGAIDFKAGDLVKVRGTNSGRQTTRELIYMNAPAWSPTCRWAPTCSSPTVSWRSW